MSRIHRRSPGTWEVVVESGRDPKTGQRQRRTFTVRGNKKDAEREAAAQLSAVAGGTYVDPSMETVSEFLHRWLRDYVDPSLALRTRLRYRQIVEGDLIPHLGMPEAAQGPGWPGHDRRSSTDATDRSRCGG